MPDTVKIHVNGRAVAVPKDVSVAAALFLAGESTFRKSVTGEPRAPLCGMGICFECTVTIDGHSHCRSCQIAVREGMVISRA